MCLSCSLSASIGLTDVPDAGSGDKSSAAGSALAGAAAAGRVLMQRHGPCVEDAALALCSLPVLGLGKLDFVPQAAVYKACGLRKM